MENTELPGISVSFANIPHHGFNITYARERERERERGVGNRN
jgi:hypothetical protein